MLDNADSAETPPCRIDNAVEPRPTPATSGAVPAAVVIVVPAAHAAVDPSAAEPKVAVAAGAPNIVANAPIASSMPYPLNATSDLTAVISTGPGTDCDSRQRGCSDQPSRSSTVSVPVNRRCMNGRS